MSPAPPMVQSPGALEPLLVDVPTAARLLSISERTLRSWTDVPRIVKGGRVLYSPKALAAWIDQLVVQQQEGSVHGVDRA